MEVIDKSTWGDGPWQSEPDEEAWTDAVTGLPCKIARHPHMGMLCGYVGVPAGHPLFGQHYDNVSKYVEMHGGSTFAEAEEDGLWWIGFDCGHAYDLAPGMDSRLPPYLRERGMGKVEYRSFGYVHDQCTALAWQLHQLSENLNQIPSSSGGGAD
jgi:hypothetical protein